MSEEKKERIPQGKQIDRRVRALRRKFKIADKFKKVKKTMYRPESKKDTSKSACSTLHGMAAELLRQHEKKAFVPGEEVGQMPPGGAPPIDPATGMPMDPAMMGGMPPGMPPMDPAMMGGQPPMDPAMMDPSMGGMPPMPPEMAGMPMPMESAPPAVEEAPAEGQEPVSPERMEQLEDQVEELEKTIMDLLDMVEKSKSLMPDEPGAEEPGAAPGAVQQDMAGLAQPMGGPMGPGAATALQQVRPGEAASPNALSGLLNRLQV